MYITTTGLILRSVPYKESSLVLTVLTASEGKITVSAKGARRKGSKLSAAVQLLSYSELTLSHNAGRWTLTEGRCLEQFQGLRDDLELLSLGAYFAEMLENLSDEDSPSPEMLALGLNALFMLSEDTKSRQQVKAAFEMRLMAAAGYAPSVEGCGICGRVEVQEPYLDLAGGIVRCRACRGGDGEQVPLCPSSLEALRYILSAPPRKLYAFRLQEDPLRRLGRACESYVRVQTDREFRTLAYYKNIKI